MQEQCKKTEKGALRRGANNGKDKEIKATEMEEAGTSKEVLMVTLTLALNALYVKGLDIHLKTANEMQKSKPFSKRLLV